MTISTQELTVERLELVVGVLGILGLHGRPFWPFLECCELAQGSTLLIRTPSALP